MLVENYPGEQNAGLDESGLELREALRAHVEFLSLEVGERNVLNPGSLHRVLAYIKACWESWGYRIHSQDYFTDEERFTNLWVEVQGSQHPEEVVVVGAHYDTFPRTPGADDNATAVAGLLELSRRLAGLKPGKTIRFVAFANEEPPYFMSDFMGSYVYARQCRQQEQKIAVMVCLEMLGYFNGAEQGQANTYDLLPDRGDFICLCGNPESKEQIVQAGEAFRKAVTLPLSLVAVSEAVVPMVAYSDHWSFWQCGWPAFMVTDTGPLRNPHYHEPSDLPETLDFDSFTRVLQGVEAVVLGFASPPPG